MCRPDPIGLRTGGEQSEFAATNHLSGTSICSPRIVDWHFDRIQTVNGWVDAKGQMRERLYDLAVSDGRTISAKGRCHTPVGNTVNVANASYTNAVGDTSLTAFWKDPDFDARLGAVYCVRVIEIPTPRWTAYDAKRFGIELPKAVRMTVQDRAYTSPFWYTP